jgi:hypothetical protein
VRRVRLVIARKLARAVFFSSATVSIIGASGAVSIIGASGAVSIIVAPVV